ncbi:hypothetical protein IKO50_05840 [bacterium]|nr:hypothetical protein [bacterium]
MSGLAEKEQNSISQLISIFENVLHEIQGTCFSKMHMGMIEPYYQEGNASQGASFSMNQMEVIWPNSQQGNVSQGASFSMNHMEIIEPKSQEENVSQSS